MVGEGILRTMGTLYIVGTPIGNLEDLTERSRVVLGSVVLVAAEDTRVTRRLLNHIQVRTPLISYNTHNWQSRIPTILESLNSGNVALVSDAGMPVTRAPLPYSLIYNFHRVLAWYLCRGCSPCRCGESSLFS